MELGKSQEIVFVAESFLCMHKLTMLSLWQEISQLAGFKRLNYALMNLDMSNNENRGIK